MDNEIDLDDIIERIINEIIAYKYENDETLNGDNKELLNEFKEINKKLLLKIFKELKLLSDDSSIEDLLDCILHLNNIQLETLKTNLQTNTIYNKENNTKLNELLLIISDEDTKKLINILKELSGDKLKQILNIRRVDEITIKAINAKKKEILKEYSTKRNDLLKIRLFNLSKSNLPLNDGYKKLFFKSSMSHYKKSISYTLNLFRIVYNSINFNNKSTKENYELLIKLSKEEIQEITNMTPQYLDLFITELKELKELKEIYEKLFDILNNVISDVYIKLVMKYLTLNPKDLLKLYEEFKKIKIINDLEYLDTKLEKNKKDKKELKEENNDIYDIILLYNDEQEELAVAKEEAAKAEAIEAIEDEEAIEAEEAEEDIESVEGIAAEEEFQKKRTRGQINRVRSVNNNIKYYVYYEGKNEKNPYSPIISFDEEKLFENINIATQKTGELKLLIETLKDYNKIIINNIGTTTIYRNSEILKIINSNSNKNQLFFIISKQNDYLSGLINIDTDKTNPILFSNNLNSDFYKSKLKEYKNIITIEDDYDYSYYMKTLNDIFYIINLINHNNSDNTISTIITNFKKYEYMQHYYNNNIIFLLYQMLYDKDNTTDTNEYKNNTLLLEEIFKRLSFFN